MNQVTRTAEQLTKAELLFKELIAEDRQIENLGIIPHEFETLLEADITAQYEAWKTGEEAPEFQTAFDKWLAAGEPTPVLTEKASAQEQA